ncbi:HNH endonuclease [Mycolicibacterium mucogenicum DSM 44124]|nr:HNH endonuclease [Mycolicibacterium mucogenicum DSM 44124]
MVVALVATIALAVSGQCLFASSGRSGPVGGRAASIGDRAPSDAQAVAAAASAAFVGTALASDGTLSAEARSAKIPSDPVAGWDLPTTDGRSAQLVLPAGLGAGEHTPAGQVVYPDRGAGFSVIAENQGSGGRTITRIPHQLTNTATAPGTSAAATSADGQVLPMVPMFLRTPANTVMLAHTSGIITLNQATPAATTIATIAAPQARDSRGSVVPSAFVTQQIRPGLYLLAQVIRPDSATVWPVYADPCFSCMVDSVVSAAHTVADATVVGAKAVGNFVKNNPLESAEIVGGSVLMVTGVGTGFGASLVLSGTTGLVQKAAAADPTNQVLAAAGDALEVANYISPARSVQKGLTAIAERGAQKLGDDVAEGALRDVAAAKPVTPTPSPQLATDVAGALTPKPGVGTPAMPTGPPAGPLRSPDGRYPVELPIGPVPPKTNYEPPSVSQPAGTRNDCGDICENPATIYSEEWTPGTFNNKLSAIDEGRAPVTLNRETDRQTIRRNRNGATSASPSNKWWNRDEDPLASSLQSTANGGTESRVEHVPDWEGQREGDQILRTFREQNIKHGDAYDRVFRGDDGQVRCAPCAIDRRNRQDAAAEAARARAQANVRGAGTTSASTSTQRSASQTNVTNNTQDTTSRHGGNRNNSRGSKNGAKKNKKQSTNKKHRKGQK